MEELSEAELPFFLKSFGLDFYQSIESEFIRDVCLGKRKFPKEEAFSNKEIQNVE